MRGNNSGSICVFISVSCDKTYTEMTTVQPEQLTIMTDESELQSFKTIQVTPNEQENMDVSNTYNTGIEMNLFRLFFINLKYSI